MCFQSLDVGCRVFLADELLFRDILGHFDLQVDSEWLSITLALMIKLRTQFRLDDAFSVSRLMPKTIRLVHGISFVETALTQMSLDSLAEEILLPWCGGVAVALTCREAWKSHGEYCIIISAWLLMNRHGDRSPL